MSPLIQENRERHNPNLEHAMFDFESKFGLPEVTNTPPMPPCKPPKGEGRKFDSGKADWSLLPLDVIEEVVEVLDFGAAKYDRDNWKKLDNLKLRCFAAALRHLTRWQSGELVDPESGKSHLSHAQCNLMFMRWSELNEDRLREQQKDIMSALQSRKH